MIIFSNILQPSLPQKQNMDSALTIRMETLTDTAVLPPDDPRVSALNKKFHSWVQF